MARLAIKPIDRHHMLVWRQHPSTEGDPGWRTAPAINGIPIEFGKRHHTHAEALDAALNRAGLKPRQTVPTMAIAKLMQQGSEIGPPPTPPNFARKH